MATNETTNLTFGLTAAGDRKNNFSYARSLMNWENNDLETGLDWRGYVKFSQRFVDEEGEEGAGRSEERVLLHHGRLLPVLHPH